MSPVTCLAALAAAGLVLSHAPAVAGDQSSVPPPVKSASVTSQSTSSSVPPPVPMSERSATDLMSTANTASSLKVEGLVRAAKGSEELLERGQKVFDVKGNLITVADIGVSLSQGNYADATRKGAAAVIDKCVDAAIVGACAMTGPAAPGCALAVQTARFCGETYFNQSVGGWFVEKAEQAYTAVSDYAAKKIEEFQSSTASQQSSFEGTRTSNEQHAAAVAAMQPAPYSPSTTPYDNGSDPLLDALMAGLGTWAAPQPALPPVPLAAPAPAAPSGPCHDGHDESAHPGGCNDIPLGRMQ